MRSLIILLGGIQGVMLQVKVRSARQTRSWICQTKKIWRTTTDWQKACEPLYILRMLISLQMAILADPFIFKNP